MLRLAIEVRYVPEARAEMLDTYANQIPFANALALTADAKDAQDHIRRTTLPARFTLRRPTWAKQGIRIQAATKSTQVAIVRDINAYMALQQSGGVKIPFGSAIAVPLSGARKNVKALIDPENMPHAVMQRGGFIRAGIMYAVTFKRGRAKRLSRALHSGGRFGTRGFGAALQQAPSWSREIVPMYALVKRAVVKPRYGFDSDVMSVVRRNHGRNWAAAFEKAVKTKR